MAKDNYDAALGGLKIVPSQSWQAIGMEQLEYPKNHPRRKWYDDANAEHEAKGESYRVQMPNFTIPARTVTGLPNRRDVVGRFLLKMRGESGRFYTDGFAIYSYGTHWRMAYRSVDQIMYDDHMWEKPYSGQTSGHMSAVRNDPRLFGKIANEKIFPEKLKERIVESIVSNALSLVNMNDFFSNIGNIAPMWGHKKVMRACFKQARGVMKARFTRDLATFIAQARQYGKYYTPQSLTAQRAFFKEAGAWYVTLVGEYEKRFFKSYGEKMPPIPIRRAPKRPELVRKIMNIKVAKQQRTHGTLAWHFLDSDRKLRFGDNREVTVGSVMDAQVTGSDRGIVLCNNGLHGSVRMTDAYGYFAGPWLSRTLHYGVTDVSSNKIASQFRECLGMIDLNSAVGEPIRAALARQENVLAEQLALEALLMTAEQTEVSPVGVVEDQKVAG